MVSLSGLVFLPMSKSVWSPTGQDVFAVSHEQVCFNAGAGAVTGEAVVQKNGLNLFDIKLNLLSRELLRCVFVLSYHRKTNKEKYGNGRQFEDHLSTCLKFSWGNSGGHKLEFIM